MNSIKNTGAARRFAAAHCLGTRLLDRLQPLLLLGFRLYLARVFLLSGLTKTRDWSSTVALFTDEYHVPFLPPAVAAALGAATELLMPILLVVGLGSRLAAGVISYYETLVQTGGVKDHILWGTMLLVLLICGPGQIAVDTRLERWIGRRR
jgi:putative oxidoreductase